MSTCTKVVTLPMAKLASVQALITKAVPQFDSPFQSAEHRLDEADYPAFFNAAVTSVENRTITLTLDNKPVYIRPVAQLP